MTAALYLILGLGLTLFVAHLRTMADRNRRASEELRRRFPTQYGGPKL